MKKLFVFALALCLLAGLAACGAPAPEPTAAATPAPTPTAAPTAEPTSPPATPSPTPAGPDWQALYTAYLTENYTALAQACYGSVAGVGFIDLDLDTVPELLVFDAGASASMGVQFFDIADGAVECVSASSVEVGELFGGAHFVPNLYVNANYFQDFRLREAADGSLYFEVNSYNGAEDFRYSEIIRFRSDGGVLTLETVACAQTALNPETQAELYTVYTVGDTPIDQAAYNDILAQDAAAADLGYEARGVFVWEDKSYGQDAQGFAAMLAAAVAAYVPAL